MKNIDLFIVDANKTIRQRVQNAIGKNSGITIIASSSLQNETDVRSEIIYSEPDVLLLGIDSMESEEMKLFEYLRKNQSHLPVLIMTHHNRKGAEIAISALKKGAVEFFPKTTAFSESILPVDFFKNRVVPVVKAVPRFNRSILLSWNYIDNAVNNIKPIPPDFFKTSFSRMDLLAIVGCLGGVAPLYLLLSGLPKNLPVPVVIVQHMIEIYSEVLVEDLKRYTQLTVKSAEDGDELKPGTAYIAPGNYHVITKRKRQKPVLKLHQGPKVGGFRPSIDNLLESSVQVFGKHVLTVYLSGGGSDGIEGAKMIDIIGGRIIVQNKKTSLLSDISWKIESLGINEGSYPVERLAHEITDRLL